MNKDRKSWLDELDIHGICMDLLHNIGMIIMSALTCSMIAMTVLMLTYQATYSSTATFAVMSSSSNNMSYTSIGTSTSMANILGEIFQSNLMKKQIAEDLGIESFDGTITASRITQTNFLRLTVTTGDPMQTYLAIQSIMENYSDISDYTIGNANVEVLIWPQVPTRPSNVRGLIRTGERALVVGAVLMMGIIVLFSVLRKTVKNQKSAVRNLDGKYLGTAPHEEINRTWKAKAKKYNKGVLLTNPFCSRGFLESLQRMAIYIEYHMKHRGHKILMVTSSVENEGKTTITANLALSLAQKGNKVLVIDMDLRKPAVYKIFEQEIRDDKGLMPAMEGEESLDQYLVFDEKFRLYFLLNKKVPRDSQGVLTSQKLKKLLREAGDSMDYIILDTPPMTETSDVELISSLADDSILVVRQDWIDVRDINDNIDILKQDDGKFMGYILNNVYVREKGGRMSGYAVDELVEEVKG